jgi:hypothetical protein
LQRRTMFGYGVQLVHTVWKLLPPQLIGDPFSALEVVHASVKDGGGR